MGEPLSLCGVKLLSRRGQIGHRQKGEVAPLKRGPGGLRPRQVGPMTPQKSAAALTQAATALARNVAELKQLAAALAKRAEDLERRSEVLLRHAEQIKQHEKLDAD
jgi:hypothetical protein